MAGEVLLEAFAYPRGCVPEFEAVIVDDQDLHGMAVFSTWYLVLSICASLDLILSASKQLLQIRRRNYWPACAATQEYQVLNTKDRSSLPANLYRSFPSADRSQACRGQLEKYPAKNPPSARQASARLRSPQ